MNELQKFAADLQAKIAATEKDREDFLTAVKQMDSEITIWRSTLSMLPPSAFSAPKPEPVVFEPPAPKYVPAFRKVGIKGRDFDLWIVGVLKDGAMTTDQIFVLAKADGRFLIGGRDERANLAHKLSRSAERKVIVRVGTGARYEISWALPV